MSYEVWCVQCDFGRNAEDVEVALDLKESHEEEADGAHFVEFQRKT